MDETQESLALTVHLLADTGNGSLLQQALDQLLDCICPEVRLFLVSERARPVNYHEKYHPRRARFPGMSVSLFLQESLGQERLFRVLDFLQHSPWQGFPTQHAQGRPCTYLPANQEFYSLHNQMPVWGIRPAHCGTDILRVTLYCSFDNYEDAIRLYEMILQRDATLQKSNFCVFVLYATNGFSLQLSLKQLPLGVPVDPKESSVLQFKVQEIGQLVPLLPNPCVPISSTRWQTQDYDGNKILLQVFRFLCFLYVPGLLVLVWSQPGPWKLKQARLSHPSSVGLLKRWKIVKNRDRKSIQSRYIGRPLSLT